MQKGILVIAALQAHRRHLAGLLAFALLSAWGVANAHAQLNQRNLVQPQRLQPPPNGFQTNGMQSNGWNTAAPAGNSGTMNPNVGNNFTHIAENTRNTAGNSGVGAAAAATNAPNATANSGAEAGPNAPVRSLLQMFHDGGLMMYPIALCSFILTVIAFERFIHLRAGRVIPRPFVKRLIEQLQQQQIDREEAIELCDRNPSPIAGIMAAAIKRYGRPSVEVEQAALDAGERESNQLRRYLRLFSAISNVCPLLGLLGTVLGMIQAFNDIAAAQAMGRPEMLAGGISQALLTTAAGLLVAIPAYLLYIYFVGHVDRLIMEMDKYAQRLVDAISAEGLQENDSSRSRSRSRKAA